MPQLMQILGYLVYFWSNEGVPREPIHVHIAKRPTANGTKIWILKNGSVQLANNNSKIPKKDLKRLMSLIESFHSEIEQAWKKHFALHKIIYLDGKKHGFSR